MIFDLAAFCVASTVTKNKACITFIFFNYMKHVNRSELITSQIVLLCLKLLLVFLFDSRCTSVAIPINAISEDLKTLIKNLERYFLNKKNYFKIFLEKLSNLNIIH